MKRPVMVKVTSWTLASGSKGARYWQCKLACGHGVTLVRVVDLERRPSPVKCATCTNARG